jgi:molybdate transport system ATP-binding protein
MWKQWNTVRQRPEQSSIQNVIAGRVDAIGVDEHPGLVIVRVRVGDSKLVARLTKRAVADLNLEPDQEVWIQVKSVALME